jgi:RNA polymerase primary sigma factor
MLAVMPSTRQTPVRATRDVELDTYMRDVARYPVMTPAEERARAERIVELRIGYWRALLAYPPYIEAIADVIQTALPDIDIDVGGLVRAARRLRDRRVKKHVEAFAAAVDQAAPRLSEVDPESLVADRIAADLASLASGSRRGVGLEVHPPRRGSRPFEEYRGRVAATSAALNLERNAFARANLRLVVRMAHRFRRSGLPLSDLVQEGNIGLLKAVDRFDVSKGFRFSTYASWWIRHHVRRAVVNRARTIRLPQHVHTLATKLHSGRADLRRELGREPTDSELANVLGIDVDKLGATRQALGLRAVSLDAPLSEGDPRSVAETLATDEEESPVDRLDLEAMTRRLRGAMLELAPMERDILRQRFGLDGAPERTLAEIGQQYSLSRERIRQLQVEVLARMRDRLGAELAARLDA